MHTMPTWLVLQRLCKRYWSAFAPEGGLCELRASIFATPQSPLTQRAFFMSEHSPQGKIR
jgi:hypothetical protein